MKSNRYYVIAVYKEGTPEEKVFYWAPNQNWSLDFDDAILYNTLKKAEEMASTHRPRVSGLIGVVIPDYKMYVGEVEVAKTRKGKLIW